VRLHTKRSAHSTRDLRSQHLIRHSAARRYTFVCACVPGLNDGLASDIGSVSTLLLESE
jgi:hypothetical protein